MQMPYIIWKKAISVTQIGKLLESYVSGSFDYAIVELTRKDSTDPFIRFNQTLAILKDPDAENKIVIIYQDDDFLVKRKTFIIGDVNIKVLRTGTALIKAEF